MEGGGEKIKNTSRLFEGNFGNSISFQTTFFLKGMHFGLEKLTLWSDVNGFIKQTCN